MMATESFIKRDYKVKLHKLRDIEYIYLVIRFIKRTFIY